jgi:hypothetical protein
VWNIFLIFLCKLIVENKFSTKIFAQHRESQRMKN